MPAYEYSAIDAQGKQRTGVLESDSPRQLRQQLRARGLLPLQINAVQNKSSGKKYLFRQRALTKKESVLVTRHLSALLATGMPIADSLWAVAEQLSRAAGKSILLSVRSRICEGYDLARSLGEFPASFSATYCAAVKAGEQTGQLANVLEKLADDLEQQQMLRHKILQAMLYPGMLTAVALSVITFLLTFVVPKIVAAFSENHQTLPWLTVALIHVSSFIKHYGLYLLLLLIGAVFGFHYSLKTRSGLRERFHLFLLRLPLLSYFIRLVNTTRFLHTFALLLQAGVEVLQALHTAADLLTSIPLRKKIMAATQKVREGNALHRVLREAGCFPALSLHLIASGENTGRLSAMLERSALTQERLLNSHIDTLLTLFEPVLILTMGLIVLLIVLAILLPIFSLDQMV